MGDHDHDWMGERFLKQQIQYFTIPRHGNVWFVYL